MYYATLIHIHSFLCLQITGADVGPQVKWAVNLVTADGKFNFPQGFCVGMFELTYSLYHPKGWNHI